MSGLPPSKRHTVNKIFGDALPDTTSDEREAATPEGDAERDQWLQENKPPHHG